MAESQRLRHITKHLNDRRTQWDSMYNMGFHQGYSKGLVHGILIGAIAVVVLAAGVLGDFIRLTN